MWSGQSGNTHHVGSLVPRPLPDFISQRVAWRRGYHVGLVRMVRHECQYPVIAEVLLRRPYYHLLTQAQRIHNLFMGKETLIPSWIIGWQISLLLYLHEGSNSQTNNRAVNLPLFTWSGWPVPTSSGVFGDASSYWIPARVICVLHAKPAMDCTTI